MPKLWKCKPLFSQTFIQALDFHQVAHSSEAKKEICASAFPLRCVIRPLPQSSRRLQGWLARLGQAGDSERTSREHIPTKCPNITQPHTQGFHQVTMEWLPPKASHFYREPGSLFLKNLRSVPLSELSATMGIV